MEPDRRTRRRSIRFAMSALLLAVNVASARAVADGAGPWSLGLRAGMAGEGQQHTLQSGAEFGLFVDRVTGGPVDLGLGAGYALDAGGGSRERDRVAVISVETHVRTSIERPRPYLELGLGYYWIDRNPTNSTEPGGAAQGGVGGYAAIGADFQPARLTSTRLGIGVAYHLIAAEVSASGGNAEDYWTLSATLRWGGRPH